MRVLFFSLTGKRTFGSVASSVDLRFTTCIEDRVHDVYELNGALLNNNIFH